MPFSAVFSSPASPILHEEKSFFMLVMVAIVAFPAMVLTIFFLPFYVAYRSVHSFQYRKKTEKGSTDQRLIKPITAIIRPVMPCPAR